MKRAHGAQQNTRNKLKKKPRNRGKISVDKYMQEFKTGEKVLIKPEPSVKKNIPHRRFIRKIGEITGKRGKAYKIKVKDMNAVKEVFIMPIHLKKL